MNMKKNYKRPEIKKIKLMPEEAVLTGCKSAGTNKNGVKCRSIAACSTNVQGS